MHEDKILKAAWGLVQELDSTVDKGLPEKLAGVVKTHAKGAAIFSFAGAWIPGIGGFASVVVAVAFIWSMYARINREIDLPFKQNLFKTILSGIATNLVMAGLSSMAASALSFIPILGSLAASLIMTFVCYSLILASGFVYLKILTNIFRAKEDPSLLCFADLGKLAKAVADHKDIKVLIDDAKSAYLASKATNAVKTIEGVHDGKVEPKQE